MCSKLAATFTLFPVLSLGYAHTQLRSFYRLSTFEGSHVRKYTRLSLHVQLQYCVLEQRSLGTRLLLFIFFVEQDSGFRGLGMRPCVIVIIIHLFCHSRKGLLSGDIWLSCGSCDGVQERRAATTPVRVQKQVCVCPCNLPPPPPPNSTHTV